MPYTPTPNIFVDGRIIKGEYFSTEFNKISEAIADNTEEFRTLGQETLEASKQYTEDRLNSGTIDGGTF